MKWVLQMVKNDLFQKSLKNWRGKQYNDVFVSDYMENCTEHWKLSLHPENYVEVRKMGWALAYDPYVDRFISPCHLSWFRTPEDLVEQFRYFGFMKCSTFRMHWRVASYGTLFLITALCRCSKSGQPIHSAHRVLRV